ncbi:MAG: NAD(+)/NADH kinase [Actinomycetota bacterium]|nr:NAD(+)/NADH kinase [Actinomycetota bacterium]
MTIKRLSLVTHDGKPAAVEMRRVLTELAAAKDISIQDDDPDLVVALGGDGTVLRAAQVAHAADALLLGINLGTMGYLTEVEGDAPADALEWVLRGDFEVDARMMLQCELITGSETREFVGLNEVLVERASRRRLVRLEVTLGGESLAAFNADGLIVATPTGSTAYALSSGGPIVSPRAACLVLVPVNAHMIFSRPFVLSPDETVEIRLGEEGQTASLVLDGAEGCDFTTGSTIRVRRHPQPLRLVRLPGPGFVQRLRTKLDLPH